MIPLVSALDIRADLLINRLKDTLKTIESIKPPEWALFSKTGSGRERPPEQEDWWYIRAASILRTLYVEGPLGTERLRAKYGNRKSRGVSPSRSVKGSGHVIRKILQQLEEAGLVEKDGKRGRKVSAKGRSLLDKIASDIAKEMKIEVGKVKVP